MSLPLDPVATIFIFLIGLPAILLQTLPAELRRTVLRERKQVALSTVGPIVLAALVVAIGVYQSAPKRDDKGMAIALTAAELDAIWLPVISVLLVIAGGAALLFTERWRRTTVIDGLRRQAAAGIDENGRPVEEIIAALVELGQQSNPGEDKGLVIDALAHLVAETQDREGYDGSQLEHVLSGIEEVFLAGAHNPSSDNFRAGAELLLRLVLDSSDRPLRDDLKGAVQLASILGRASLRYEQPHIQLKFIEALAGAGGGAVGHATVASQALFEVGSQAIEEGRALVAMAALSKLELLVGEHQPVRGELAHDYIALLAHVWVRGLTGRDYAIRFLSDAAEMFAEPLEQVIIEARMACLHTARFRSGDCLAVMLADIRATPGMIDLDD